LKKPPLHTQIIIGLVLGLVFGLVTIKTGIPSWITIDFIKPIGTIFINGLKMIAMPLVLASLIIGVANLGDISKLSRIGGKTLFLFLITTIIAIVVGLGLVNIFEPGESIPTATKDNLMNSYASAAGSRADAAAELHEQGPLQPIVDMVPENLFHALTDNTAMLQVVLFAILAGIALLQIPKSKAEPVIAFFDGLNDIIIQIVNYIMAIAPYGICIDGIADRRDCR
jgi:proton glutamate symport protein